MPDGSSGLKIVRSGRQGDAPGTVVTVLPTTHQNDAVATAQVALTGRVAVPRVRRQYVRRGQLAGP